MKRLTASSGTKSKLAKPVQELIKMIFDVESMKKAMVEFEVRLFIYFGAMRLRAKNLIPAIQFYLSHLSCFVFRSTSRKCPWES